MAEEKKLQEEELDQVFGGMKGPHCRTKETCKACGREFEPSEGSGTKIVIDNGCGKADTVYYKCPDCGYKWER